MVDKPYFILCAYTLIISLMYAGMNKHIRRSANESPLLSMAQIICFPLRRKLKVEVVYLLQAGYIKASSIVFYVYSAISTLVLKTQNNWRRINTRWYFAMLLMVTFLMAVHFIHIGIKATGRERIANIAGGLVFILMIIGLLFFLVYFKEKL